MKHVLWARKAKAFEFWPDVSIRPVVKNIRKIVDLQAVFIQELFRSNALEILIAI
jgi:hypothetical protein